MKLVNYQLQNQIEYLSEEKTNTHFKEYLQSILEDTSKPYYQRADYIGLSLNEIKTKIDYLSKDIQELQALKKKLSTALEIAKVQVADIFVENGIDRMDGNVISSLTLAKPTTKEKNILSVKDESAVMGLGYVKFSVDEEALEKALNTETAKNELNLSLFPTFHTAQQMAEFTYQLWESNDIVGIVNLTDMSFSTKDSIHPSF